MELLRRHIHVALGRGKGKYTLAVAFSGFFSIKMFVHFKLKIYCVLNLILREISEKKEKWFLLCYYLVFQAIRKDDGEVRFRTDDPDWS